MRARNSRTLPGECGPALLSCIRPALCFPATTSAPATLPEDSRHSHPLSF